MKLESKRLKVDCEDLNAELVELAKLKQIVEKNLEEALESLQQEREQKHALKKELDQRVTSESIFNLQSLASLGLGLDLGNKSADHSAFHNNEEQESSDNAALRKIEADVKGGANDSSMSGASDGSTPMGDLFSEIHVNEVRKLEKMLEDSESEKGGLTSALESAKTELSEAKAKVEEQQEKIAQVRKGWWNTF